MVVIPLKTDHWDFLNCHSDPDGVFIVHYVALIRDRCCVGTHMNEFAWAINQWSCWFRGF